MPQELQNDLVSIPSLTEDDVGTFKCNGASTEEQAAEGRVVTCFRWPSALGGEEVGVVGA